MTGEGEVKLEAPDGIQVTLSSFKKLTACIVGKVNKSALDKKPKLAKPIKPCWMANLIKGGTVTGPLTVEGGFNLTSSDYLVKSSVADDKSNNIRNTQGVHLQGVNSLGSNIF